MIVIKIVALFVVVSVSLLAVASDLPGAPSPYWIKPAVKAEAPSAYWTRMTISLVALDALAKSADMMNTMKNTDHPNFQEYDPLGRPFVEHGRAIAGVSQSLLFAGEVFVSYELKRHNRPRMAHAILLLGIGGNTAGIVSSKH
jgi:hypothetical protein